MNDYLRAPFPWFGSKSKVAVDAAESGGGIAGYGNAIIITDNTGQPLSPYMINLKEGVARFRIPNTAIAIDAELYQERFTIRIIRLKVKKKRGLIKLEEEVIWEGNKIEELPEDLSRFTFTLLQMADRTCSV